MRKPYFSPYGDYWNSVHFPAFGYVAVIVFTASVAESFEKRFDTLPDNSPVGIYHATDNGGQLLIAKDASCGTIAHESWHAVSHMLERMGAEHEDEIVAHCLGHLVDEILNFREQLVRCYPKEFKRIDARRFV